MVAHMNSAATMWAASGRVAYLDQLERIAYNALPAAFFNGTMWSLNYFQQVNKLDAIDGEPKCESGCTYCFGMVYECCVSNHAQGWPKFLAKQWQVSASGRLALTQYFASRSAKPLTLPSGSTLHGLTVSTDYPFGEVVTIEVSNATAAYELEVRVPGWCKGATLVVDGTTHSDLQPGTMHAVRLPSGDAHLLLTLPMRIRVERRPPYVPALGQTVPSNAATILHGPLVYALPRVEVHDHATPFDDPPGALPLGQSHGQNNYLLGTGEWRNALLLHADAHPEADLRFERSALPSLPEGQGPFASSLVPARITAKAVTLTVRVAC